MKGRVNFLLLGVISFILGVISFILRVKKSCVLKFVVNNANFGKLGLNFYSKVLVYNSN